MRAAAPDTPTCDAAYCAVDVETSGLRMSSRVVEIGAVGFTLDGGCREFQALINPCERISPQATAIHGITDEMVSRAPKAADVLPDLLEFMDGRVFVAHNARFDVRMLGNELSRVGAALPGAPVVCTLGLSRRAVPGAPDYRLETLVGHLGLDVPGRLHNALPDAYAAMRLFAACLDAGQAVPVESLPGYLGPFDEAAPSFVQDMTPTGGVEELAALARFRLAIEMDYASSPLPVVVTPLYLYEADPHRYMKAYCHRTGIHKTYRLDRIIGFRRTR